MKCTHSRYVRVEDKSTNPWTGEEEYDFKWEERSTFEDIDLHRYKCTQCGEVMYYSGAAHDYYEKGIGKLRVL